MVVQKTSVFPASRETVFENLRRLEDIVYMAVGEYVLYTQAEKMD